jgi:glutamine amidotransferase
MIAIIDCGVGNLKSLYNMFNKLGVDSIITSDIDEIERAHKYVLSGVGAFDHGMKSLRNCSFFDTLEKGVLAEKKPVLGICLGMQMLTNSSEEGLEKGLGWLDAQTVRFDQKQKDLPIPHMGWNSVEADDISTLFKELDKNRFYFVHSYHVVCNKSSNVLASSNYGNVFTSSISDGNIFGVQFHPEKSHKFGMKLLKNFEEL